MIFLIVLILSVLAIRLTLKHKVTPISYAVLLGLSIFTILLMKNNIDAGNYADVNGVAGDSVGWFAPHGFEMMMLSVLATVLTWSYIITKSPIKSDSTRKISTT